MNAEILAILTIMFANCIQEYVDTQLLKQCKYGIKGNKSFTVDPEVNCRMRKPKQEVYPTNRIDVLPSMQLQSNELKAYLKSSFY